MPLEAVGETVKILGRRQARSDWRFRRFVRVQCGVCVREDQMDAWHLAASGGRYWWLG